MLEHALDVELVTLHDEISLLLAHKSWSDYNAVITSTMIIIFIILVFGMVFLRDFLQFEEDVDGRLFVRRKVTDSHALSCDGVDTEPYRAVRRGLFVRDVCEVLGQRWWRLWI